VGLFGEMAEGRSRAFLLYLAQEGRGIGLVNKLRALWAAGIAGWIRWDANRVLGWGADERNFSGSGATMLRLMGIKAGPGLLTNNPDKMDANESPAASTVTDREPHLFGSKMA